MRFFIGWVLTLALGVMGCSETDGAGGSAGDGGSGGIAGSGGTAGSGGVGGDGGTGDVGGGCIPGEFGQLCATDDFDGWCIDGVCMPYDCSDPELDEVACVIDISPETGVHLGFCILGECEPAVEDCSGEEDETLCDVASGAPGLCFEQLCYMNPAGCETAEPGDPCWAPPIGDGPPGPSVCVIGDEGSIVCAL